MKATRPATTYRIRWAGLAAGVLATGAVVVGCGEDGDPDQAPEDPADHSAVLNGPSTAEPGRVVLLTVTNTGDARDSYGFTVSPADAGVVKPRHLTVEPGRSGKLKVKVLSTPVTVEVESVGGGPGIDALTIR